MKKILCSILSIVSFLYYLWLGIHNGFGLSVLPFWLLLSILFLFLGHWKSLPFSRRIPRFLTRAAKFCLTAFFLFFFAIESLVVWGMTLREPAEDLDYLIVLGAGVNENRPSHTLELRLERALDYLDSHPDTRILVSGGQGSSEKISEAESMYQWLLENGVDSSRILMENHSTTTAENMRYSIPIIQSGRSSGEVSIGIVTSNFHIFRSLCLADHACDALTDQQTVYHLYGLPADFPVPALPHYMVREFFTICVDTLLGNMGFPF